jgi:hypothetical protein
MQGDSPDGRLHPIGRYVIYIFSVYVQSTFSVKVSLYIVLTSCSAFRLHPLGSNTRIVTQQQGGGGGDPISGVADHPVVAGGGVPIDSIDARWSAPSNATSRKQGIEGNFDEILEKGVDPGTH